MCKYMYISRSSWHAVRHYSFESLSFCIRDKARGRMRAQARARERARTRARARAKARAIATAKAKAGKKKRKGERDRKRERRGEREEGRGKSKEQSELGKQTRLIKRHKRVRGWFGLLTSATKRQPFKTCVHLYESNHTQKCVNQHMSNAFVMHVHSSVPLTPVLFCIFPQIVRNLL